MESEAPQSEPQKEPQKTEHMSYGTLVALVIILAIIVVGALYLWGERIAGEEQGAELPLEGSVELNLE